MNVMQAMADLKQNLHRSTQSSTNTTPTKSVAATLRTKADDSPSNSTSDSTTITANDFLSLLVAEMKNQDPTADQDPNAYIDQLVQVNSLQQLIAINQDLNPTGSSSSNAMQRSNAQSGDNSIARNPAATMATSLAPRPPQPAPALSQGIIVPTSRSSVLARPSMLRP